MMRAVIAIGGNAISKMALTRISSSIASLHEKRAELVITHGNGVQVGELASVEDKSLSVLTAQTEAEIGLSLMGSISAHLRRKKSNISIVITRVLVNSNDPEFRSPTKPIGRFYSSEEAKRIAVKGIVMKHLIHGYRRVVPSPKPLDIMETGLILTLLRDKYIVIAAGGGGIPVSNFGQRMKYHDAVIDKDYASSLLARKINADALFILTNVNGAYLNFGKRNKKLLHKVHTAELKEYIKDGQFEEGSMLPKVKACIDFVEKSRGTASIGSLSKPSEALGMRSTVIIP